MTKDNVTKKAFAVFSCTYAKTCDVGHQKLYAS